MEKITLSDSAAILNLLNDIALRGKGFRTECLLDNVLDEGFTHPDHFIAEGEDPNAFYQGKPNAWASYHIRQWKKVMMVYGGAEQNWRFQITETP
jgi:hypothetical protein